MDYENLHCCPNNCVWYRNEYKELDKYLICRVSRWKISDDGSEHILLPKKVYGTFQSLHISKRMFKSVQTIKNLTWHIDERKVEIDKLRHPIDSPSWKLVDQLWPDFMKESRSLRVSIAAVGINLNNDLSSHYNCWLILMVTYNLPP